MLRFWARLLAVFLLASGSANAANQTIDFSGLVIPNSFGTTFDWDGYRVTVSGGFQPSLSAGSGFNIQSTGPNENLTVKIVRIDAADFVGVSTLVSNQGDTAAMTVGGYNNNVLVGSTSTTVPVSTNNVTAALNNQTIDEIRITCRTNTTFAQCGIVGNIVVNVPNLPPVLASYIGSRSYTVGAAAITLDGGTAATLTDSDSADFNGGSVRVSGFIGKVAAQDVYQVGNVGTITLDLGTGNVADSAVVIGQVSSNGQAGADLVVTLNASATPARVQNLIRALQYFNTDNASPYIQQRTIYTYVSDGDGAPAKNYTTTINFTLPADPANTQKVNFNAATTVPDISATTATSVTSQGFTFALTGGSGQYLQAGGSFPGAPGANMGATGGGTLTLTINRTAVGTDFSLDSFVLGNATTQSISVDLRLNGASVATRTLPANFAQRMDFGGMTIDQIVIVGNSTASPFFQAGTFDEMIYYPSNLSPQVGSLQGDTATFTQGGTAVALDAGGNATLTDVDSPDFNGGNLTASIIVNKWSAQDVLQVGTVGTITVSGANVLDNGTVIGTFSGGTGGSNLVVSFNASATPARIQNLLRALQYNNTEPTLPDLGNRTMQITLIDGDSSSPTDIQTTVKVLPSALPAGKTTVLDYTGLGSQALNTTQIDYQNYRISIAGGFQRYLQSGSENPTPPGVYGGDTGISTQTITLQRIDAADFFAYALVVKNYNGSVAMTVRSLNNGATIQTLTLPAGGTQRLLFNDNNAIDQITISGTTSSTSALLAYVDELAVKPPNTAPTTAATAGSLAYTENAAATVIDSGITVTDPDNNWSTGTLKAQITANPTAADTLTVGNVGTVTVSGLNVSVSAVQKGTLSAASVSNGTALTVTFNASATTADVQAVARAFQYLNSSDAPSTTARTVTFTVTDSVATTGSSTRGIAVTAVNDAPITNVPGILSVNEDSSAFLNAGSVQDADSGAGNLTLTFAVPAGTLTITGNANVAVTGSPGTSITASGTAANLNSWLAAGNVVSYAPVANASGNVTMTVSTTDNGNAPGPAQTDSDTVSIAIAAVNDPPVLTVPATLTVVEDSSGFLGAGSLSDLDSGSGNLTVTFSVPSGTLTATGNANVAVTGSPGTTVQASGTAANLNGWLVSASVVSYQPAANATANVTMTVSTTDNGNTPGPAQTDSDSVTISITGVNDAPVVTVPATLFVLEDGSALLPAGSVSDVDSGSGTLTMTFTVANGTLTLSGNANVIVSGSPGASVQASGTAANLNSWLGGGNVVSYQPVADASGSFGMTVVTTDNGNTPGPAKTDSDNVAITVAAVPDAEVSVSMGSDHAVVNVGDLVTYTAVATNQGPEAIASGSSTHVQFPLLPGLSNVGWTCVGSAGGTCTANGSGAIDDAVGLPLGGVVTYTITTVATAAAPTTFDATFRVVATPALQSNNPGDDSVTVSAELRLFSDGFE